MRTARRQTRTTQCQTVWHNTKNAHTRTNMTTKGRARGFPKRRNNMTTSSLKGQLMTTTGETHRQQHDKQGQQKEKQQYNKT